MSDKHIRVSLAVHTRLKIRCVQEGASIKELAEVAINRYLDETNGEKEGEK